MYVVNQKTPAMVNQYYCELEHGYQSIEAGIYTFNKGQGTRHPASKLRYIDIADRVWKENEVGVFVIKNTHKSVGIPNKLAGDELKEFMWIKLKAQDI
jgi:hypothetical protein